MISVFFLEFCVFSGTEIDFSDKAYVKVPKCHCVSENLHKYFYGENHESELMMSTIVSNGRPF